MLVFASWLLELSSERELLKFGSESCQLLPAFQLPIDFISISMETQVTVADKEGIFKK